MMLARLSLTVMVLIGAVLMNFSPGDMAGLAESNRQGKIRVAVDPHLPPFQFMDEGTLTGFNIDILEKVAEYQQLEVEYVPVNLEQSVDALANGEVDVILGIHFSADYAERMEFSDRFFTSSVGVLVPAHEDHIKGLADLSNRIVALQRGTVEYDFLRNIRRVKYHVTSSQAQAFELLQRGRAEVFVGNRHTAEYLLQEYGVANQYQFVDGYLLPLEYALAVPGGRYQLLHTLNRGLRTVVHEGDYTQIYNHWFGQDPALVAQRLRTAITVIVSLFAIALMMMVYGMYWNRKLQQEVDNKTKDLQEANRSLAYQIEETKNSQQFKEQILDSSPRGIVTCDRHGLITSFNPKALEIVGVEEKPLGRHYSHIPLISALFKGKISQVLAQGQQFLGEEYDWAPDGQTTYHLRYYVYPLYDYEKHVTGVILSFEDVTEEYRLREQLFTQEKNRALGQLVAGIAHEIRNPLTSIKTFAELIPSKFENAVFRQEMATHVPKEIERLNQLIGGLIDYAKPRRAKKEPV